MSLQDKLDAFKADFEGRKAPAQCGRGHAQGHRGSHRFGSGRQGTQGGRARPEFTLPDAHGRLVRSAVLLSVARLY